MNATTNEPETRDNLSDQTVNGLQELLQANIDSAKGFEEVASDVKDPFVKVRFEERAKERHAHATELSQLISKNGKVPASDGSWLAAYHRTWIATKAALTSGDGEPLLAEVIRGEKYLAEHYESVIKSTGVSAVNDVLHRQYAAVLESLKRAESEKSKLSD